MSLIVSQKHRVLRLTLNRPEKRNALNADLCTKLVQAVKAAQNDPDIGSILISANGSVFSSGMDLEEASNTEAPGLAEVHNELFAIGATSVKPIVVCVNGAALGGGLGLVAQGHVVVSSESAVFGLTEIRVGLWPFLIYRSVEAAIGARRTLQLSLTGQLFHASEASHWGLVHQISSPVEVCDRAKAVSREIAKASPATIAAGLNYVVQSRGKSWHEAGELAAMARVKLMKDDDFREGCAAFLHKREPHWPSMPPDFYADRPKDNSHA
jgi:enoyl-CoA hydratase/carnithine racemase